jgi:competence protein ComEC
MRAHLFALGAMAGAWLLLPVPWMVVLAASGCAVRWPRPAVVMIAACLATGWLGTRALDGLEPLESGSFEGWVTLVEDPRSSGPFGVRATARVDGQRVSISAHGPVAGRVANRLAGEQLFVIGTAQPLRSDDDWARWRHEAGRITITSVVDTARGSPIARLANEVRRTLSGGAAPLSRTNRALYLGMVIGDDRGQSPVVADDFRAAGLGHLLVVSGQNVSFVLAIVAPLLVAARPGVRIVALSAVLVFFAVLTRFEPSVLRAVMMAGVSIGAVGAGSPIDGRKALSVAVGVLLLIDPFLVHVVAFQLSAAATTGIVWLAAPLGERLGGPGLIRIPFATTAAAQIGVAPLLLVTFGPVPLASLPANLLAGPASGPVMIWGCTAGLLAGIVGGPIASIIHSPTWMLLWWIRKVASLSAAAPPAMIGGVGWAVIVGLTVLMLTRPRARLLVGVVSIVLALVAIARAPAVGIGDHQIVDGVELRPTEHGLIIVLDNPGAPRIVLRKLRRLGIGEPSLIVASDGDLADALMVLALRDRYGPVLVLAPELHRVPTARTARPGDRYRLGDLLIEVIVGESGLDVVNLAASPVPGRGPPR